VTGQARQFRAAGGGEIRGRGVGDFLPETRKRPGRATGGKSGNGDLNRDRGSRVATVRGGKARGGGQPVLIAEEKEGKPPGWSVGKEFD